MRRGAKKESQTRPHPKRTVMRREQTWSTSLRVGLAKERTSL